MKTPPENASIAGKNKRLNKHRLDANEVLRGKSLKARLVRGATGSFGLKIASMGLMFLSSILLTRIMGAEKYGGYIYAISWINLLIIPAVFGLDRLLTREVAIYLSKADWPHMRGIFSWGNRLAFVASCILAAAALIISSSALKLEPDAKHAFQLSVFLLPILALTRLRQGMLSGLHRVVLGQLPELLVQPVFLIALAAGTYWFLDTRFTSSTAVGIHILSASVAFIVGLAMLWRYFPIGAKSSSPQYERSLWMKSAIPLLIVGGMSVINTRVDLIMLGAIKGPEEVAIYAIAVRGSELVSFPLLAINAVMAPAIASMYANRNHARLQQLTTQSARAAFMASLLICLFMVVFGYWFLLIFGKEFTSGQTALTILSVARLYNVGVGAVGLLLTMTGFERDVAIGIGVGAVVNLLLNAILIPLWSYNGAAVATATSMLVWNTILVILVYRRLAIQSTILGRLGRRGRQ